MTPENTPLLILAGGLATRLRDLAKSTPKYLQPIDGATCFADLHLRWVSRQGFNRVFICVGHLGEQIESYCGRGEKYGLEIEYLFDGDRQVGTGGAVLGALKFPFTGLAVTYGDTLLSLPVAGFLNGFSKSGMAAAMSVYRNKVSGHFCNSSLEGSCTIYDKFSPKTEWKFIDYGFLAFRRETLEAFSETIPFDLALPLTRLSQAHQLFGYEATERFFEIGSPEALAELRRVFVNDSIGHYDT